jgi:secreted trypsin-like serine protease
VTRHALWLAALATALLLALPASAGAKRIHSSVVGGEPASIQEWPFIAALVVAGQTADQGQFCGGSVADELHVITAAHCVEGEKASGVNVVVNRSRLADNAGERVAVASIAVEPAYDNENVVHDVAILKLASPVGAGTIAPAGSGESALGNAGRAVSVAGWGLTSQSPPTQPDVLQQAALTIVSPSRCRRAYGSFDSNLSICAGTPDVGRPDSCQGDSGGPLVGSGADGLRLVGIVSFGGDVCGDPESPGAYTRVSSEASFIAEQLGGAPPPPPPPPPPPSELDPRVEIGRIWCKTRCYVEVGATGPGADTVPGVIVRVRRSRSSRHKAVNRSYAARRLSATRWRAKVGLPFGVLKITARAVNAQFKTIGSTDRVTVEVVPG